MSAVEVIAAELGRHKVVALVMNLPDPEGWERDGYRCACGGTFDERRWPPRASKRELREPVKVNPRDEHVASAIADALALGDAAMVDPLCDALVAARQGVYDGQTVEQHLEHLINRVRRTEATR